LPVPTPVTTPVWGSTVAVAGVPLFQIPFGAPLLLKLTVDPTHTLERPVIVPALGNAFTVTGNWANVVPQVLETMYRILEVPIPTPVTSPKLEFTVATAGDPLSQVPFRLPLELKIIEEFKQTVDEPLIVPALGEAFTCTLN